VILRTHQDILGPWIYFKKQQKKKKEDSGAGGEGSTGRQ
jgi:hypothetical protein